MRLASQLLLRLLRHWLRKLSAEFSKEALLVNNGDTLLRGLVDSLAGVQARYKEGGLWKLRGDRAAMCLDGLSEGLVVHVVQGAG